MIKMPKIFTKILKGFKGAMAERIAQRDLKRMLNIKQGPVEF